MKKIILRSKKKKRSPSDFENILSIFPVQEIIYRNPCAVIGIGRLNKRLRVLEHHALLQLHGVTHDFTSIPQHVVVRNVNASAFSRLHLVAKNGTYVAMKWKKFTKLSLKKLNQLQHVKIRMDAGDFVKCALSSQFKTLISYDKMLGDIYSVLAKRSPIMIHTIIREYVVSHFTRIEKNFNKNKLKKLFNELYYIERLGNDDDDYYEYDFTSSSSDYEPIGWD